MNNKSILNKPLEIFQQAESIVTDKLSGPSIFIINVCSDSSVFCGGLSKEISKFYPIVKTDFEVGTKSLGKIKLTKVLSGYANKNLYICNMIACNNKFRIKYASLIECMLIVKNHVHKYMEYNDSNGVQLHIHNTAFPCSKNEFHFIKKIIADVWDNIPIYYY